MAAESDSPTFLSGKKLLFLLLGVLFLLYAVGTYVRLAPLSRWGVYVTADDPVLHVRVTEYVLKNGHLPRNDTLAWYPWGKNWETGLPNFRYYLTAGLYSLGRSFGMDMSLYDFCVLFPAFFAPLAVFPMFLLVRKLKGWKSGLLAAAVLVLSPGYLTRTIAGFYRHEHVGLPLLILSLYFFVRAIKEERARGHLICSALSGVALVLLTGTWSGFRFLLDGYAVFVFLALLIGRMDKRLFSTFLIVDGLALVSTFFWPRLGGFYTSTEFAIPIIVILTVLLHKTFLARSFEREKLPMATIGTALALSIIMFGTISNLPSGRYEVVVNPLRTAPAGDVSQTVAEHASMQLQFQNGRLNWPALSSYGIFLFLVPLGVILPFVRGTEEESARGFLMLLIFSTFLLFLALEPYPALICYIILWIGLATLWYMTPDKERPENEIMMMIIFALLAAYFFKNMIRLNILFSAFVAIQSGLCFGYGLSYITSVAARPGLVREEVEPRSRKRRERRKRKKKKPPAPTPKAPSRVGYPELALMVLAIVFLIMISSDSYKSARGYPLGLREDWFKALSWIENNSEPDDVIMSWWDYGYWIQTYAHRPTIADGATTNWTQIRKLARAFVTTEIEAIEFCKEYNVRYIMVDVSDDFIGGKWTAMAVIAKQNVQDYMSSQDGKPVILDKGSQTLLFKMASVKAMSQTIPLDPHFQYKGAFESNRGVVVVYEFIP